MVVGSVSVSMAILLRDSGTFSIDRFESYED